MFDYIQNIRSHHTVPCTAEILHTVMRSTIVGQTCAEIADCHEQLLRGEMSRDDFETKKSELKRRLPAFCFQAQGGLSVAGGCRCLTKELDMIAC